MSGKYERHGLSNHRLHGIWRRMKNRCSNPNDQAYDIYGAKGIKVCQEWDTSFLAFYNWAKKTGYEEGLTLDRLDSDKDYQPDNCRWITRSQNTSRAGKKGKREKARYITFRGRKQSEKQWADEIGITTVALRYRLNSPNWTLEEALTMKSGERRKAKAN